MRKNQIEGLMKSTNTIESYLKEVRGRLDCAKTHNPKDYRGPSERQEAIESFEYCENELLNALLEINKITESMIKKIDFEAWRER